MPFIGKDWRSPGEAWVKTEDGSWEKVKILPFLPPSPPSSSSSSSSSTDPQDLSSLQQQHPHHHSPPAPQRCMAVTIKSTREVAGYNTISEAFYRLDFVSAISDVRRFHYVTKLLHLLINQNLTSLSGCATKVLFSLLQQLTRHVSRSRQHVHVLRTLLQDVKRMISSYYCWGRPLGSTQLWDQHLQTLDRICAQAEAIQMDGSHFDLDDHEQDDDCEQHLTAAGEEEEDGKENRDGSEGSEDSDEELIGGAGGRKEAGKADVGGTKELPEELVREILLRLSDYEDVVNSSLAFRTPHLLDESHIWRELCRYHFTKQQVRQAGPKCTLTEGPAAGRIDFEQVFHLLRRRFGLKEEYADTLVLCRYCRSLFWRTSGHACGQPSADPSASSSSSSSSGQAGDPSQQQQSQRSPPVQQRQLQQQRSQPQPAVLGSLQQQLNQQIQQHVHPHHPHHHPANQQQQQLHAIHINQPHQPPPPHLHQQQHPHAGLNNQHGAGNQQQQQPSPSPPTAATTTTTVPLHIPIPPQAFLKFFSL